MEEINDTFQKLQQNSRGIARSTADERVTKLRMLEQEILRQSDNIRKALAADLQKPELEANFTEIFITLHELRHTVKNLAKWMRPIKIGRTLLTATARAQIRIQPKGVVLIVAPWNFPINLTLTPFISAIAAGNCVVVKPSEFARHSAQIIEEIISAVFPANEAVVIQGDKTIAERLLQQPFDHIFFTGSPAIGKLVMKAAAEQHASVTLELGGKSPVIVDVTADIEDTAKKLSFGKFLNCGQTCIAPDYVLVHSAVHDRLVDALKKTARSAFGDDKKIQNSQSYARLINPAHFERIKSLLDDAREKGAQVEFGGQADAEDCFIAPTLLSHVGKNSDVLQQEIFGPLLPVISFDTLDQAIDFINARPKPLAMYIFSKNRKNVDRILSETSAGGTTVNDFGVHYLQFNLPFGGVGASGFGSAHGHNGFRAFSHERAVAYHHRWSALKLFAPPYTKFKVGLTKLLIKYL